MGDTQKGVEGEIPMPVNSTWETGNQPMVTTSVSDAAFSIVGSWAKVTDEEEEDDGVEEDKILPMLNEKETVADRLREELIGGGGSPAHEVSNPSLSKDVVLASGTSNQELHNEERDVVVNYDDVTAVD
ncbi:hypothetical protein NE237_029444 [Protea cynaroides]|uniref:Uncharacterized protein n=1 Tax=Protea cynaroides TaxID=273540 RepID=A0A9Q0GR78_9MAGN|nr:hypothetical protein NE237_029444 [Protea cynaroides]